MQRKRFEWKLRTTTLNLGERTLIAGVLNVTPDSFSDGGKYSDPDRAFARAIELEEQGADIIDIGAESTRPGSDRISEGEELRRLIPVLKKLQGKLQIPISVDTYKAAVATKAFEYGAEIINDPSGLTFDPDLAAVVANANAALILNHMRGTPDTWAKLGPLKNPVGTIAQELDAAVHRATRAGVDRKSIVADPGLGFGKRREQNAEIMAGLEGFAKLVLPLMIGPSRKHFLARESEELTEFTTAAAVAACILGGAHILRVHDVVAMRAVAQIADEILKARIPEPEIAPAERTQRAWMPDVEPPKPLRAPYKKAAPIVVEVPTIEEADLEFPDLEDDEDDADIEQIAEVQRPAAKPPAAKPPASKPPASKAPRSDDRPGDRPFRPFKKPEFEKKPFRPRQDEGDRPAREERPAAGGGFKTFAKPGGYSRAVPGGYGKKNFGDRPPRFEDGERPESGERSERSDRPFRPGGPSRGPAKGPFKGPRKGPGGFSKAPGGFSKGPRSFGERSEGGPGKGPGGGYKRPGSGFSKGPRSADGEGGPSRGGYKRPGSGYDKGPGGFSKGPRSFGSGGDGPSRGPAGPGRGPGRGPGGPGRGPAGPGRGASGGGFKKRSPGGFGKGPAGGGYSKGPGGGGFKKGPGGFKKGPKGGRPRGGA